MDSLQQPLLPSMSEGTAPHEGPVPMFDLHLKYLSDSYLSFFQERRRIEEIYIDSLLKLYKKNKAIDAYLDGVGNPSTTVRRAWSEVKDNCEREAQARQAFLTSLVVEILRPLADLRETQDRTRKRIKEDLKDSSATYNSYAEKTLPRLKRTYLKKCQEAEDSEHYMPSVNIIESQPLYPGQLSEMSRNRSPSSSIALSDLAHQGKRQLQQLVSFREKSDFVKDSPGSRTDNALRSIRAKKEVDEADREYRRGVYWLETLRIRRAKILEAGYNSVELFITELADQIKRTCEIYSDILVATSTTQTQLALHLRESIARIAPAADGAVVAQNFPRLVASGVPRPVLYSNYDVGDCNDLIFGVSLVDYAQARALKDGELPNIVRICLQEIDAHGLEWEGIHRVSGRHLMVKELQRKIEKNEQMFKFNPVTDDVYVVSSLLKLYLRELPEAVFRYPLLERIQHSEDFDDHKSNNFALLRAKIRRLPPIHQSTLRAIIEHLARVAQRSLKNKMDIKNLAIEFGSVLFGEDEMPKGEAELLVMQSRQDSLMEDLIKNTQVLFDDRSEPPLALVPSGEAPAM